MRITSIKITEKANLGNYESLEFAAEAVLEDGDEISAVTARVSDFVNWHARRPEREAKARNCRAVLKDEQASEAKKHEAQVWLDKYEERRKAVEAM